MTLQMLVVTPVSRHHRHMLERAGITLHLARDEQSKTALIDSAGGDIEAVLTIGTIGFCADDMDRLPNLKLICAQGVGFEGIDVAAAHARGIHVSHGPGTNAETVADHALGLALACVRRIPQSDRAVREGQWQTARRSLPALHDKRLGILGMGHVGQAIARRAWYGFNMAVEYYSRYPKPNLPYTHVSSAQALAERSDILIVALPGGPDTHHLVNDAMLAALGENGILINIGRGSVVDTHALAEALRTGTLGMAGLDVLETEPDVPEALTALEDNLIMTPHTAGLSPSALDATIDLVIQNVQAVVERGTPVTPVPT
ncbi:2-hydroxyacid dehydrogenase [Larsenimonas suaedae]|uniref:2-hydroxyacid dehydrogenase n=1 Tax=Larsenimonas suaedae TaxID=1851019 RepID=A0ABU1GW88_9GAMM|nr:2-hydroxyacid dehydrogenase [Larsenimonas suaedae]MCM2973425.1 2-hydroxyacid dehydrogenase [Larsenimonas suaedae]MDR5896318.1 2-hydroxyacid dehydrogenase [Larsenimonas suaedae]